MSRKTTDFKDEHTTEILNCVYRNAKMAQKSTQAVLRRCQNNELYGELCREQDRYKTVASRARRELARRGAAAHEANACVRAMVQSGIAMKTAAHNDTSSLASLMYKGTNNGIIDMQRTLNRTKCASENIRQSAENLLAREQQFCDDLKRYL